MPVFFAKVQRRILDDRLVKTPDITGVTYPKITAILPGMDQGEGRSEDMTGIIKSARQVPADGDGMPVRIAVKQLKRLIGIGDRIQRLDFLQLMGFNQLVDGIDV